MTIFFLENFPLYGVCIQPCSTVNDRSWVEEGQGVKLVALPFSYSPELTTCWLEYDRLKTWPAETHDKYSLYVADVQSTWLRSWISFWINLPVQWELVKFHLEGRKEMQLSVRSVFTQNMMLMTKSTSMYTVRLIYTLSLPYYTHH